MTDRKKAITDEIRDSEREIRDALNDDSDAARALFEAIERASDAAEKARLKRRSMIARIIALAVSLRAVRKGSEWVRINLAVDQFDASKTVRFPVACSFRVSGLAVHQHVTSARFCRKANQPISDAAGPVGLCIVKREWVVTHEATGRRVTDVFSTKRDAIEFAKRAAMLRLQASGNLAFDLTRKREIETAKVRASSLHHATSRPGNGPIDSDHAAVPVCRALQAIRSAMYRDRLRHAGERRAASLRTRAHSIAPTPR